MRTLFAACRVADLEQSLDFYRTLGYLVLGRVAFDDGGRLAVLGFPDESVATLELIFRPNSGPVETGGFDHLAIQVDDLDETLATLTDRGLAPGEPELPGGPDGPRTAWLVDPDGYRIELVQWPAGHPYGLTAADFPDDSSDT
jgi:lactoylglutathione lyase